ncbi:CCA tRNA nucleotidyltransferase [Lentibacillus halophilus]|uniref:CCA-adding enzyme n=1 Tax=Lentibacillus halophilus TaxID=295065 RepID=A0ABP3JA03_9BACI
MGDTVIFPERLTQAMDILMILQNNGYKAYFVGGCVRDLLNGQDIGDIDIATSASPENVRQIFDKVIPVGLEHGTVIVRYAHQSYEVTTFRTDGDYSDQRHPDTVRFMQTIDADLKRRDFTINALAMDIDGHIVDLFNGREDIRKGLIRTVGNGVDRFREDPLRIIRAIRFSGQLGFSIAPETRDAMIAVKQDIETVAVERIAEEMGKFFSGACVQMGMDDLRVTAIHNHMPIIGAYPNLIDKLPEPVMPLQTFGAVITMFYRLEPDVSIHEWVKRWKCSNKVKHQASELHEAMSRFETDGLSRWLVYCLPAGCYKDFTVLIRMFFDSIYCQQDITAIEHELPIDSKRNLAIDGTDIRALFPNKEPGSWIGDLLNKIEKHVVTGHLHNDKYGIRDWIKWHQHVID